ncbi:hypothetical protein [Streptomyces sp. 8N706]|uniref:hypothetical protein n=1 Tax=Streptomyces sp. 8N706 TaxID=3457416 RepID=UPI003FD2C98E
MSALRKALPCSVVVDLTAAGFLCADIAHAFRMADALFCEARLSSQRVQISEHHVRAKWDYDYWHRRITECARFRERTALIYLDTAFGYCVAVRRVLHGLRSGGVILPDLVQVAMEEGASIAAAEEIVSQPPGHGPHVGRALVVCPAAVAYEAARGDVLRALETAGFERAESLHTLLADSGTDAGEAVVKCLATVNRYAEALHLALCHDQSSDLAAAPLHGTV